VRWLAPEKLHLTLVFLGDTDPARVTLLTQAMAVVAGTREAFAVSTGEAGGRIGGRRGGVAWLRLAQGGEQVADLARATDEALGSDIYDDRVVPRPHLTVARGVTEQALNDLRKSQGAGGLDLGWKVDRITLFRSHTERSGSRYEALAQHTLRG
jgi:2'-5' RNA ligase